MMKGGRTGPDGPLTPDHLTTHPRTASRCPQSCRTPAESESKRLLVETEHGCRETLLMSPESGPGEGRIGQHPPAGTKQVFHEAGDFARARYPHHKIRHEHARIPRDKAAEVPNRSLLSQPAQRAGHGVAHGVWHEPKRNRYSPTPPIPAARGGRAAAVLECLHDEDPVAGTKRPQQPMARNKRTRYTQNTSY